MVARFWPVIVGFVLVTGAWYTNQAKVQENAQRISNLEVNAATKQDLSNLKDSINDLRSTIQENNDRLDKYIQMEMQYHHR